MTQEQTKAAPKKMGRPSKYTEELAQKICDLIREGKSERQICKMPNMPTAMTLRRWKEGNPDFCAQSARAREESAEKFNDELLDLQDELNDQLQTRLSTGEDFPKGAVEAYKVLMQEKARQAAWRDDSRYGNRKTVKVDATEDAKGMAEVYAKMLEAQKDG
jgi:hypothetical protein|nr:MAG TPA: DNA-binding protein [Caudoviricetes sp.]